MFTSAVSNVSQLPFGESRSERSHVRLCVFVRFHAERAIDIITHILPEDHLLLASSKRVKGEASSLWAGCCRHTPLFTSDVCVHQPSFWRKSPSTATTRKPKSASCKRLMTCTSRHCSWPKKPLESLTSRPPNTMETLGVFTSP